MVRQCHVSGRGEYCIGSRLPSSKAWRDFTEASQVVRAAKNAWFQDKADFDVTELEKVRQLPIKEGIATKPTMEELKAALAKLKNGKASSSSRIFPEMVKAGGCRMDFLTLLLDLVHTVWEEQRVPRDWSDAILIPIPKKGDRSKCDNWRGISLLEVVGRVMARILQERLQRRKGMLKHDLHSLTAGGEISGTSDQAIHSACGLTEAVRFDAPCSFVQRLGVPDSMIRLVQSFH